MDNPEVYDGTSEFQRRCARELLNYIASRMTWGTKDPVAVLDFGCGQGFVTKNILLPLLTQKAPDIKIYGLDISKKMINFSSSNYGSPNIIYVTLDLLNGDTVFPNKVDKIFSSFALHWIKDQG